MEQLENKTTIITGGGTGIGFSTAKRFYSEGAAVVICGRREEVLQKAAEKISPDGDRILWVKADICREQDIINLVDQTINWKNRIDILINNAGAMRVNKPPEETSLQEWQSVIDTNITGTFLCTREVGKVMIRQKQGSIINIGSISGLVVNKYFHGGSYEVSKSAIHMMTKVFAAEWAQHNINVNAVAPGYYDTEPNRNFFKGKPDLYNKVLDMIPVGLLGNIEQLSKLILTLATDTGRYMTGTTIPIDGGYTIY